MNDKVIPIYNIGASYDARICIQIVETIIMRTTVNLDEKLLDEARRITGIKERTALLQEGLRALIERESARRLARLGGSEPQLQTPPRRRTRSA
jgi:Arc/MetJ family transcription regulator